MVKDFAYYSSGERCDDFYLNEWNIAGCFSFMLSQNIYNIYKAFQPIFKTTKLILLDSLLQETYSMSWNKVPIFLKLTS